MTSAQEKDFAWGLAKGQERGEGGQNNTGTTNFCSRY